LGGAGLAFDDTADRVRSVSQRRRRSGSLEGRFGLSFERFLCENLSGGI